MHDSVMIFVFPCTRTHQKRGDFVYVCFRNDNDGMHASTSNQQCVCVVCVCVCSPALLALSLFGMCLYCLCIECGVLVSELVLLVFMLLYVVCVSVCYCWFCCCCCCCCCCLDGLLNNVLLGPLSFFSGCAGQAIYPRETCRASLTY